MGRFLEVYTAASNFNQALQGYTAAEKEMDWSFDSIKILEDAALLVAKTAREYRLLFEGYGY